MSETPMLDELRAETRLLLSLLDDPHPGLFTWLEALGKRLDAIAAFGASQCPNCAPKEAPHD